MASILDFLNSETGKEFIQKSSDEVNESPEKVKSAMGMALPMILGALKNNARTPEGAENINRALQDEKHSGSVLDNITNGSLKSLLGEGSGILGHIFGGKQGQIEQAVGSATGMDTGKVSQLLQMAAPVVMGILGNQVRKDHVDQSGIPGLIGSVMGSNSSHDQSLLETLMNADNDGSVVNDVVGKLFGGKDKSGGLGSFFKG